jgi:glycosyltransferase involved in cell wall biosynthesis
MTAAADARTENAAWPAAQAKLSVLIPFKGDDPTELIGMLGREAAPVELVILDDGTGDPALAARVAEAVRACPLPALFLSMARNLGRAKGRNRLAAEARAEHLLFLDSDMAPDDACFLARWLEVIAAEDPAVVFGGFSLKQVPNRRDQALHRRMAAHSDCLPSEVRQETPEKHIFTSNLLVRRDVFAAESFDEGFTGWGWEDVEWGMRVARRWPIRHVDNTATHLGLDTAATLAAKYEQSAANFARVATSHPEVVRSYPSYRVAQALKRAPLMGVWRPMLKAFALADGAPLPARAFAMRLYRAALYAEAI